MIDEENDDLENDGLNEGNSEDNPEQKMPENGTQDSIIPVSGMYREWFLDYASYVILERAVPAHYDGLKPVQRRILHSMKELEDGRYNKVANIIGNTMKYHPHGDASITDAMVQIGNKNLLIDMQGNWGNTLTGDRAAAARYIEARLSKFALEVVFNPKTTNWQSSYDGRNKEPIHLPIKFPLLLAHGGEGIAVGLACKFLPHNFIELIDASIAHLRGKRVNLLPDFQTGGLADFSNYNEGLRGGKVRVRARIRQEDKKTLVIHEIPYGTTTSSLIDSILKANDKGKIKVKKVEDNTAEFAEIVIHLPPGVSPDKSIDALFAFTDCEVSISPNSCVIEGDTPVFKSVNQLLKDSTDKTVALLKLELEIKLAELNEQWHFSSLEKIFIENKIYVEFDGKTYDEAIVVTHELLKPHIKHLIREVTDDDVKRLMEIKMRRITKHDSDKADNYIASLEEQIAEVKHHLANLIDYAIEYFKTLKKKYSEGKERKTEIRTFDTISKSKVVISNKKLYVNRAEGFVGYNLKKDEFICDCSDIDDIIVFRSDGSMQVSKIADKKFYGKDIIHVGVWKKGDARTIYHMIYQDGKQGPAYMKRFAVTSITRDKEYVLTKGSKGTKLHHFSVNPNGENELVQVILRPRPNLRKLRFEIDFSELAIKGRAAAGNRVTKYLISKVVLKERGGSTLAARKIWFDDVVRKLNDDNRGELLGEFSGDDKILTLMSDGTYHLYHYDLSTHFKEDLVHIEKWNPSKPVSAIYWDGDKKNYYVKRFLVELTDKTVQFISESEESFLELAVTDWRPVVSISFKNKDRGKPAEVVEVEDFIAVKGIKALGNRLSTFTVKGVERLEPLPYEEVNLETNAEEVKPEEEVAETDKNPIKDVPTEGEGEQGTLF